jgi:hypothetical protein
MGVALNERSCATLLSVYLLSDVAGVKYPSPSALFLVMDDYGKKLGVEIWFF